MKELWRKLKKIGGAQIKGRDTKKIIPGLEVEKLSVSEKQHKWKQKMKIY